jgi:hypothetical protein
MAGRQQRVKRALWVNLDLREIVLTELEALLDQTD